MTSRGQCPRGGASPPPSGNPVSAPGIVGMVSLMLSVPSSSGSRDGSSGSKHGRITPGAGLHRTLIDPDSLGSLSKRVIFAPKVRKK